MSKWLLAYDAECGPCKKFQNIVEFLDLYNRLDFSSLVEADDLGRLDSVPQSRRHRSFHLISADRETVLSGSNAIPRLISLLPGGRLVSKMISFSPLLRSLLYILYTTFARLHNSGMCLYENSLGMKVIEANRDPKRASR